MITDAANFRRRLSKRRPKNSGMVALSRCWVITLVRRPSTTHASKEPRKALPSPAQVAAMP